MILKQENEIWNLTEDSRYLISSWGNVRSRAIGGIWKNINPYIAKNGYYTVALGRGNYRTVHSLVAKSFIGQPNGKFVNHKDGNKLNNRIDNLEYVTPAGNIRHAFRTGLMNNTGELHGRATRTNNEVLIIREAVKLGHRQSDIARYFKMPVQTLSGIVKGRSYISI